MYSLLRRTLCRTIKKQGARDCLMNNDRNNHMKTIEDMPHPNSLPIVGTKLDLFLAGGGTMLHEYIDRRHKKLGPIFYEKLGGDTKLVFVSDPVLIKRLFLNLEGKYPSHILPDPWILYEKLYGSKRGLFFMNGEEWLTNRRIMNKHLLRDDSIQWIEDPVRNTVDKFICYWNKKSENGRIIVNLESDLYRLSTEVIISILIGGDSTFTRSKHYEEMLSVLSETVKKIFQTTTKLFGLPVDICQTLNLKIWRNFKESVDKSLYLAQKLVFEMLRERGPNNGLVHKLLQGNVSDETIVRIVADFIIAAGDTTPVIASIYTSGRDERYFTKADEFLPYRWDRNDSRKLDLVNHVPSATLPFAIGARSCIGRKMALLQLTEFITKVVQHFDFECVSVEKVTPVTSQVLVPSSPIELIISPRSAQSRIS